VVLCAAACGKVAHLSSKGCKRFDAVDARRARRESIGFDAQIANPVKVWRGTFWYFQNSVLTFDGVAMRLNCQKLSPRPRGGNAGVPYHRVALLLAMPEWQVGDGVMYDKHTNTIAPKPPRCLGCARPMRLLRRTSRFDGLPDLYSFYCCMCDEWHVEEGDAVTGRFPDLGGLATSAAIRH